MKKIISISILVAALFGIVSSLVASLFNAPEWCQFLFGGGGLTLGFSLGIVTQSDIPAEVLATIRQWHGTVNQQMSNISTVLEMLKAHAVDWKVPEEYLDLLTENYQKLVVLVDKCTKVTGSSADRAMRNSLLKSTVGFCLTTIKSWSQSQYYAGMLTLDDVHLMGFLLPGESGGHRTRKDPTKATAAIKAYVTQMDTICITLDHSYTENAALVEHGWPEGVHNAVIIIYASDGETEIYHKMTTHIHTYVTLSKDLRGKQVMISAAFLQHVDDTPRFGEIQPVITMPLNTGDLVKSLEHKHEDEHAAHMEEIERHRKDVERLQKELDDKKAKNNE
jgi:hypothetical protein